MNNTESWPPPPVTEKGFGAGAPHAPERPGATLALALLAYAGFSLALPLIPLPRHAPPLFALLALVVPTAMFMLLQLWLGLSLVRLRLRPALCAAAMAGSAALWLAALSLVHPHRNWPAAINLPLALLHPVTTGLLITLACSFFGMLLSRIIREPNVLLPVALVAMPVDYIGAMTHIGFTQNVVQKHPHIVQSVSVPVPTVGGLHPIAYIGPGDALFLAFFLAAALHLGLNLRGTFWGMYILLTLTMLFVLLTGIPVAALVPMGLAVILANAGLMRLQRSEVFATLYAALLILGCVVAFYAYSHAHFFRR